MRGRPKLFTSYEADSAILPTSLQRWMIGGFVLLLFLMPFDIPFLTGPVPRAFPDSGRSSVDGSPFSVRSRSCKTAYPSFASSATATGCAR